MSQVALVLTFAFVLFLFWRERRPKVKSSGALWIPIIWLLLSGSRSLGEWFGITPSLSTSEPSPLDAASLFALILAGGYVLKQRHVTIAKFFRSNRWLTVFLLYCLLAVLWSDFSFIAFKRWIKVLGNVIMVLIVLTDLDPQEAIRRVLKRTAYVFVPLSLVLIIFIPDYGKATLDPLSGSLMNVGVTNDKNALGHVCMVLGVFFFWNTLLALRRDNPRPKRGELFWSFLFLCLTLWLLEMAGSATSLASTLVGMIALFLLGLRFVDKRFIGTYLVIGILALVVGEKVFGIYHAVLDVLGRDPSFTGRTKFWPILLSLQPNPILGAGFESFFMGTRLEAFWAQFPEQLTEAHNGYLELYLNLGFVGLALFAGLIFGTFRKIRLELLRRFELGRFRLAFLIAILVYNYTEAAFREAHTVYIMFFLIAIDYPAAVKRLRPRRTAKSVRREGEETVVPAAPQMNRIDAPAS
jgi:exopolysaccharide production protein ExoQ